MRDQGTCSLLGSFMALLFLPEAMIPSAFRKLKRKATSATLQRFAAYVEKTWITIKLRLAAIHLERILTVYSHKQRRGRVAQRPQQKSARKESASPLPSDRTVPRRKQPNKPADPNSVWKEIMQNPKENLPPAAVKNIQPLGPVRKWREGHQAVAESLFRTLRTSRRTLQPLGSG